VSPCPSSEPEIKLKPNPPPQAGGGGALCVVQASEQVVKDIHAEKAPTVIEPEPHKTILDSVTNCLSFAPSLQKAFTAYAQDEKLKETDKAGIKTRISLFSNQLSVFSNLVNLVLPNSKAFEGINKIVDVFGQYTYRAMIGISAFAKFTKVSKNNDLIASVMSFVKTIFALNAQSLLALPFRLLGVKAKFNLPFENFYSWLGATNGPMNVSSAAANAMMTKAGFKTAGESLSAFKQQFVDVKNVIKERGLYRALKVKAGEGAGVHGTLGGTLQFIGFLMKQIGLIIKPKHAVFGEALAHSGSIIRNQIACVLTDIERFHPEKMEKGKIESVASGVDYTIEGVLDEAQQIGWVQEKAGKQIRALMGLFGTWAAATNAESVNEDRKDFHGTPLIKGEAGGIKYVGAMLEAMLKANAGHSVPKSLLPKSWFGAHDAA